MPGRPLPRLSPAVRRDIVLDSSLLVLFVLSQSRQTTGQVLHEWIGSMLGLVLCAHVALHWNWVARTTRRLFAKRPGRDTLRWVNNLFLLLTMSLCIGAGLFASTELLPMFGLPKGTKGFWLAVHLQMVDLTLFSLALHIALSWRWIWTAIKRIGRRSATPAMVEAGA